MEPSNSPFVKIISIAVVGCLLLGSFVFLVTHNEDPRDIDTTCTQGGREGIVLDANYYTFRDAGYTFGDQMLITIGDNQPFIALYSEDRSDVGYFEVYLAYSDQLGKMVLGQMFGGFGSSYQGEVHITYLRHIDRIDCLEHYGTKITRDQASSDAQFCNFREVTVGDIKSNMVYRSTDPLGSNRDGRAAYADSLAEKAGIQNEINLCENASSIEKRIKDGSLVSEYCLQLYNEGKVFFEPMSPSLFNNTEQFKACFEYMLENDGPFLIHCMEGKDRTGMYFILLEGICGATMEEIQADYMQTMMNFYNIPADSEEYSTVEKMMCDRVIYLIAHPDQFGSCISIDWENVSVADLDINKVCTDYLLNQCGMDKDQVDALVDKLTS